jgi:hypothetical protein
MSYCPLKTPRGVGEGGIPTYEGDGVEVANGEWAAGEDTQEEIVHQKRLDEADPSSCRGFAGGLAPPEAGR